MVTLLLAVLLLLLAPSLGLAQDKVLLEEIIPALRDSELGLLEVTSAPMPGHDRVVRRREVLSALRRAGRSAKGLRIPRAVRVSRAERSIEGEALSEMLRSALSPALAPCTVTDVRGPKSVDVAVGELSVAVDEVSAPVRSGHRSVSTFVGFTARGRTVRVAVRARVQCPEPVVSPGTRVRVVAVVGNVRASIQGEALQPGRVGDVIKISRPDSRATLQARIVDPSTVEVVR